MTTHTDTAIGAYVRRPPHVFAREFITSLVVHRAEDELSQVLRRVDWVKIARESPDGVKRVLGGILSYIPANKLGDSVSLAISSMTAAVKTSRLEEGAKRFLTEAIDSIGGEVRDFVNDGRADEAAALLRAYAEGKAPSPTRATGAKETSMTDKKEASGDGSAKGATRPEIHLTWWQKRAMALFYAFLVTGSITQDNINIEKARRTRQRYENVLLQNPWILTSLPEKNEAWYQEGLALLDELTDVWTERASYAESAPGAKKYFADMDKYTRVLVRKIERGWIDEFRGFMDLVDAIAEDKTGTTSDAFASVPTAVGDMFDTLLTREGRENWRRRGAHFVELAHHHGLPGLGFYGLVAAMLASETVALLVAGLGGMVIALLAGPEAGLQTGALALFLGLAIQLLGLATPFHIAVGDRPIGWYGWGAAILVGCLAPLVIITPFRAAPEVEVMAVAPLIAASFMCFGFFFWLTPLDGITEALQTHADTENPAGPNFLWKLVRLAFNMGEARNLFTGEQSSRLPIKKRETSFWTHIASLISIITATALWVVSSLMVAPGMATWNGTVSMSLIGMCGGIYAAGDMFRRNRLAEYAPQTLSAEEWNIIRLRRFATQSMFWGVAAPSVVEFALALLMRGAGGTITGWWHGVTATIGTLWLIFAIAGVLMIIGAFASLYKAAQSDKLNAAAGITAGALLVAGLLLATVGFHSRDSAMGATLGEALQRQEAADIIRRHSDHPWWRPW